MPTTNDNPSKTPQSTPKSSPKKSPGPTLYLVSATASPWSSRNVDDRRMRLAPNDKESYLECVGILLESTFNIHQDEDPRINAGNLIRAFEEFNGKYFWNNLLTSKSCTSKYHLASIINTQLPLQRNAELKFILYTHSYFDSLILRFRPLMQQNNKAASEAFCKNIHDFVEAHEYLISQYLLKYSEITELTVGVTSPKQKLELAERLVKSLNRDFTDLPTNHEEESEEECASLKL